MFSGRERVLGGARDDYLIENKGDAGIREAVSYLDAHNLTPIGNAYDFCYMDATSYNEEHQEDFCCIQIPVAL